MGYDLMQNVDDKDYPDTKLGQSLETISKLISTRQDRGVDKDVFYVDLGGFDTHDDVTEDMEILFKEVNDAIYALRDDLKSMNLWDKVTTIEVSEFGRTMSPNGGGGTDHGWGGNYMMFGGAVKGGQILGEYPEDLTDEGIHLQRGRLIPSTPFDACFKGIADWLGVGSEDMTQVCPNCNSFDEAQLFTAFDLFATDSSSSPTDQTESLTTPIHPSFPSYFVTEIYCLFQGC